MQLRTASTTQYREHTESRGTVGKSWRVVATMLLTLGLALLALPVPSQANEAGALSAEVKPAAEVCNGSANNPHVSNGAGGVIFKATATCERATTVTVTMSMKRCSLPNGGGICGNSRSNTYSQDLAANVKGTWYYPPTGQPGLKGVGYWQGTATLCANNDCTTQRSREVYLSAK